MSRKSKYDIPPLKNILSPFKETSREIEKRKYVFGYCGYFIESLCRGNWKVPWPVPQEPSLQREELNTISRNYCAVSDVETALVSSFEGCRK